MTDFEMTLGDRMMTKSEKIRAIRIGDIFHATSSSNRTLDCLVVDRDSKHLYCHRVTTLEYFVFDRTHGMSIGDTTEVSVIDSVEPLPPEIHAVLLNLYERSRQASPGDPLPLSRAELNAFRFIEAFHPAHPL